VPPINVGGKCGMIQPTRRATTTSHDSRPAQPPVVCTRRSAPPDFAQRRAGPGWHRGAKRGTGSGLLSEFPGLGHERGDFVLLDAAREPGQDVAEVCDGVYVAEVAGGEDREGDRGALTASV
jgi:hypothetical protein